MSGARRAGQIDQRDRAIDQQITAHNDDAKAKFGVSTIREAAIAYALARHGVHRIRCGVRNGERVRHSQPPAARSIGPFLIAASACQALTKIHNAKF